MTAFVIGFLLGYSVATFAAIAHYNRRIQIACTQAAARAFKEGQKKSFV